MVTAKAVKSKGKELGMRVAKESIEMVERKVAELIEVAAKRAQEQKRKTILPEDFA
jgi:histone H3/H4